jgi:WD40 repeat protein
MQTIMGPLQADPNYVKWVQFSPDGMRVVSSGADLALRVWDIQSTLQGKLQLCLLLLMLLSIIACAETETETGHNNWTMNDDGWVQGPRSEYLIWVPPDLRTSLLRPQNTLVISPRGWLKLDFDGASIGEDWTKIYESVG